MRKIYAVILAAGESRRFPGHKLKKELKGKTILEHVMSNLSGAGCSGEIVVLGKTSLEENSRVENMNFRYVYNDKSELGMGFSLACGTREIRKIFKPDEEFGILFTPGDMPFIAKEVFRRMIRRFEHSDCKILIPSFRERKGHPVIISSDFSEDILALDKDRGARDIIRENSEKIEYMLFDTDDIHIDIDTHEEFERYRERISDHE